MLLCRNGFLNSTRRLLTGSLTLALAYPLITVAQEGGHLRSASQASVPGPWQLYSTATGVNLAIYADFATCRQAAVTGPDMSCKPATPVAPEGPTPPVVQPPIVTTPTMNSAFRIDASNLPKGSAGSTFDRLQYSGEFGVPSDIGQFRIPCTFSHMAFDDPIVYPGRPAPPTSTRSSATPGRTPRAPSSRFATPEARPAWAERSTARRIGCRR